jgi:hypothetical protein
MSKLTAHGHSTKLIDDKLLQDIADALKNVRGWGSVEVFVQNYKVVQITERNIKKTEHNISEH